MKLLKKIGVGIISLGLISTFYMPEAKANLTVFEFTIPKDTPIVGGNKYALKLVTKVYTFSDKQAGKFLMKRVGSGKTFCKKYISNPKSLASFTECVARELGTDIMKDLIIEGISELKKEVRK